MLIGRWSTNATIELSPLLVYSCCDNVAPNNANSNPAQATSPRMAILVRAVMLFAFIQMLLGAGLYGLDFVGHTFYFAV